MKWLLTTLFFLLAFTIAHTAFAAQQTCKFETDLGSVTGVGETHNKAMGDAIEKCYMKYEAEFENARKQTIDMDRGQFFIDTCSEKQCS